jgi:hypothetical protein
VRQYIAVFLATCEAVCAVDPQATLVGPASSEFPWTFVEELFRAGALTHLDAVSDHPYRNYRQGPETAGEDYQTLRRLVARYAPAEKQDLPILSGEWGYATHTKGVSLETQAAFIARQQLANVLEGCRSRSGTTGRTTAVTPPTASTTSAPSLRTSSPSPPIAPSRPSRASWAASALRVGWASRIPRTSCSLRQRRR